MLAIPTQDLTQLLFRLQEAGVEFIVVGGSAAVLQNVPVVTGDVDIVHRQTPENITRLIGLLREVDAYFRPDFANRRLPPRESDLEGTGHLNLATKLGPLDVLCRLTGDRSYEDLIPHVAEIDCEGHMMSVLDLPMLIKVKAEANRPKDRLVLPILIAALEERKK